MEEYAEVNTQITTPHNSETKQQRIGSKTQKGQEHGLCHLSDSLSQKREGVTTSDRRGCSSNVEFFRPRELKLP